MINVLIVAALVFVVGCSSSIATAPTSATTQPPVTTAPPSPTLPPGSTVFAPRPLCTSRWLPAASDVRIMSSASFQMGAGGTPFAQAGVSYRGALGVINIVVEWTDANTPIDITLRAIGANEPLQEAMVVRTGPTTIVACWDTRPGNEAYQVRLEPRTVAGLQSVRLTTYQPAASACGPIACNDLAPPGW